MTHNFGAEPIGTAIPFTQSHSNLMPVDVLIADEHPVVAEGLRGVLEPHGFNVVACIETADGSALQSRRIRQMY